MSKFLICFLFPIIMIFATNEPEVSNTLAEEGLSIGYRAPELGYPNPEGEMVSLSVK